MVPMAAITIVKRNRSTLTLLHQFGAKSTNAKGQGPNLPRMQSLSHEWHQDWKRGDQNHCPPKIQWCEQTQSTNGATSTSAEPTKHLRWKFSNSVLIIHSKSCAHKWTMLPYKIWHSKLNVDVETFNGGLFDKKWVPQPGSILFIIHKVAHNEFGSLGT